MTGTGSDRQQGRPRLRKTERRRQILLELRLKPHVRIAELAERFGVSTETVRRDFERLSTDGLLHRAHGGASAPVPGQPPSLDERSRARMEERERIGRLAASTVEPGETLMIDSGATTLQAAHFLAHDATPCTVVTNSLPVAMALGQGGAAQVILCPGDYLPAEAAVIGADTVAFIETYSVDRCLIGASGLTSEGAVESVRGFAAVKRAMLARSTRRTLLVDGGKFGKSGFSRVTGLDGIDTVISDRQPAPDLCAAISAAGTRLLVAPPLRRTGLRVTA